MEVIVKIKAGVKPISREALALLIGVVSKEYKFYSYKELANCLNNNFKTKVTEDDIINFFAIDIEEEDTRLIHKHYLGYEYYTN